MKSRAPFIFIIITVTLNAMGIGLILPVMPILIEELDVGSVSEAAFWGGWLAFTYAGMQFLAGPLLGNLSDRFGRRPVLIGSLLIMGLDYLLMAIAPNLWWLFVARFISGATGATQPAAMAYLADISDKGKRSANFGLVGAAFGIGFILGPALGGMLGELGPRAPFVAAAILSLANAVFGLLVLKESLNPENRRPFELRRANPFAALARVRSLPKLRTLLWVDVFYVISNYVYPAIWSYFTIERFGWTPGIVGLSLAAFGVSSALVQGWLIRRLLVWMGERNTALFGLAMHVLALTILASITDGIWVFIFMPITALGVVVGPAIQGMMADRVADDAQGELQGVLASVNGLSVIISPVLMAGVFRYFTADAAPVYMPGAPFLLAAVLAVIAICLMARDTSGGWPGQG